MQMFDFIIEKLFLLKHAVKHLIYVLCSIRANGDDRLNLLRNGRCNQQSRFMIFSFAKNARCGYIFHTQIHTK